MRMRRQEQALSPARCEEILHRCDHGTLALQDGSGFPYAVPVNYIYHEGKLYFHCALQGRKIDMLRADPRVSFCVIGRSRIIPEDFTTSYESVIVFGTARLLETREEKLPPLEALCRKFSEPFLEKLYCLRGDLKQLGMVEITIAEMTGKASEHE